MTDLPLDFRVSFNYTPYTSLIPGAGRGIRGMADGFAEAYAEGFAKGLVEGQRKGRAAAGRVTPEDLEARRGYLTPVFTWMDEHRITRVTVAARLGVSFQMLHMWEYGKRPVPAWVLHALVRVLGYPTPLVEYLLTAPPPPPKRKAGHPPLHDWYGTEPPKTARFHEAPLGEARKRGA